MTHKNLGTKYVNIVEKEKIAKERKNINFDRFLVCIQSFANSGSVGQGAYCDL